MINEFLSLFKLFIHAEIRIFATTIIETYAKNIEFYQYFVLNITFS